MGFTLGKKIIHKTVSLGKKVAKVAGVAGALFVAGAYHLGSKEMEASERERDAIRERALAEEKKREEEAAARKPPPAPPPPPQSGGGGGYMKRVVKAAPPLPKFSAVGGYTKKVVPHTIDPATGNMVLKKDAVAMGMSEGPTQDPMDAAYEAAMAGGEAAGKFVAGQKKGGLIRMFKKNP